MHYFGPNHGVSNIALEFQTGLGSMLVYVDTLEIGIVPYRTLPDTNVHGYIASLREASQSVESQSDSGVSNSAPFILED